MTPPLKSICNDRPAAAPPRPVANRHVGWAPSGGTAGSCPTGRYAEWRSGGLLNMGFEEPERLVEGTREGGEDVGRAGIARLGRFVDGLADGIGSETIMFDQLLKMVLHLV